MKISFTKQMAARTLKVMSTACLLLLILAALSIQSAYSMQADVPNDANASATVQVLTNAPSNDTATQIEVSGIWPNQCIPQFESVDFSGDYLLIIHALAQPLGSICDAAATEWSFIVEFQFEAGLHLIELAVENEQSSTTNIYSSEIFYVAERLDVAPQNPDPNEPFTISVGGVHQDGCVPYYSEYERVESTIIIDVTRPAGYGPCSQAISSWQVPTELDGMEAGEYTVEVYVTLLYITNQDNGMQPERRLHNSGTLLITDTESAEAIPQPVEEDESTLSILENFDQREVSYLPFILR